MSKNSRGRTGNEGIKRRQFSNPYGTEPAQFLTIDLDVRSRRSLAPLQSVWPEAYQPLNDSRWLIRNALIGNSAETAAKNLLAHIAKLRGNALESWKQAYRRIFDIGVQAGGAGLAFEEVQLTADTLSRIAAVRGQVKVTVYPAQPQSRSKRSHRTGRTASLFKRRQSKHEPK